MAVSANELIRTGITNWTVVSDWRTAYKCWAAAGTRTTCLAACAGSTGTHSKRRCWSHGRGWDHDFAENGQFEARYREQIELGHIVRDDPTRTPRRIIWRESRIPGCDIAVKADANAGSVYAVGTWSPQCCVIYHAGHADSVCLG